MDEMVTYTIRMPAWAVKAIKEIAAAHCVRPRTLARSWLIQRTNAIKNDEIPVLGGDLPAWVIQHGTKVLPGEEYYER